MWDCRKPDREVRKEALECVLHHCICVSGGGEKSTGVDFRLGTLFKFCSFEVNESPTIAENTPQIYI